MSGTSLDGIDAALIETDGLSYAKPLGFVTIPYETALREEIRACFGKRNRNDADVRKAEQALTLEHAKAVKKLLKKMKIKPGEVDLIGFHGQTIFHAPAEKITIQIGDGGLLARECGIDVVDDFRSADVEAGGEGAPLAPLYHWARVKTDEVEQPVVILNIGGVANVTYIGKEGESEILAFDTGPGNALMDDWARLKTGALFDKDGRLAAAGKVQEDIVRGWMQHPYFKRKPPKSLDRDQWDIAALGELTKTLDLSAEDGAATLLAFTAESIIAAKKFLPEQSKGWYVCGGGRRNKALMKALQQRLPVQTAEARGWDGDATEAECFAYLAVRSVLGLSLSLPQTTGVAGPKTGGVFHKAV
jgi:anhydro-N-acetylmuramic acid kinase